MTSLTRAETDPARSLEISKTWSTSGWYRRVDILLTMRFEVSHSFACDPEVVAAALLDGAFQASLDTIGPLKERQVISQEATGDGAVVRRVRCILALELSEMAARMLGDADPAWVQVEKWDADSRTWTWEIEPEVHADLLSARGTTVISGDAEKATRTVVGDVRVHVPFYGGKVEGWIVKGISDAYDQEAERLTEWLESSTSREA